MNFKVSVLTALLLFSAAPAIAAAPAPNTCRTDYQAIVTLNVPSFGTATTWDARFGDKGGNMIRFAGGIALENGDVLAAAQEQSIDYKPLKTALVEIDNRARTVDDKRFPAFAGEQQGSMISLPDHAVIIASTFLGGNKNAEKYVRLARYDHDHSFKSDLVLKDSAYDYEFSGMTTLSDGYMVVVHAVSRRDTNDEYSVIYRIGGNGKVAWKRAYRPGIANQIYGLNAIDAHHVMAGGRVRNEDGRMAAWLMELNEDGTIVWQNTYPRGQTGIFRAIATKPGMPDGDHYIVAGQIVPYGENPTATWIMEIDGTGTIMWQRYLRATNYNLDARAANVESDGRITVMANATVKTGEEDGSDHIRLFTLSPRGEVMNDEAYMQGRRATAMQYASGRNRERIVFASIDAVGDSDAKDNELITKSMARKQFVGPVLPEAKKTPEEQSLLRQGWVFAATPLPPYNDPCVMKTEKAAP